METGAKVLPHFMKDTTDRNRTSPFAFTGNKFEFRALGSSLSVSGPNVVLNTAVSEVLAQFSKELQNVAKEDMDKAVHELIKKTIIEHKRVIFNGNGYTDEWVAEAEKRGLYNYKSTPDVLPSFIEKKNVDLFVSHGIFTESEINSRYEILLENYSKTIHIEAKTLSDMLTHEFMPTLMKYLDQITDIAAKKKQVSDSISCKSELKLIDKLSAWYEKLDDLNDKLVADRKKAEAMEDSLDMAKFYQTEILADMAAIRTIADEAEEVIPEELMPYPSYTKMLFYV